MRWTKSGIWQMIFNTLAIDADNELIMIDFIIIRAHQHSAGALKNIEPGMQGLGRSKIGFTSKLHTACDTLSNPIKCFVTAGQRSSRL
ncbi:IS5 family transposase domain protein [Candidatus Cyrtobacter comes]|uniref:IS5 family transposase domain protein n=1 Tax=Candidatus Cyrtobacter comes TaxID=675776 RepID=A0ABU5L846_9RICK|nr:hypothetical protein [Candidatus Cyrtobacter comes]MDZ5762217.1 IS5 family transposase domain protein [Candidatus Cyrtobacter comes]